MKRLLLASIMVFMLIVSGCSMSIGKKADEETMEDLNLQILKADEEAGLTFENSPIYSELQDLVESDPKLGYPNDFTLYPLDIVTYEDGRDAILFLGVNRLDDPIKNMSFELTLGKKNGEYIWKGLEVDLPEELAGVLESDSSIPVFLEISSEQGETFKKLTDDNMDIAIDKFDMDVVK